MTQKTFIGKKSLAAWGAMAAIAASSTAFAAQSDVLIEQIGQGAVWAAPIRQIVSASAGSAFVAQAQPQKGMAPSTFQANPGGYSLAQAASTEQLSQELSSTGAPVELALLGFGLDLGRYSRSGTGSSVSEDASGNVWQQNWSGDDNRQFASQEGTSNRAIQQQNGTANVSILFQRGNGNVGEILQFSDQGVATVLQNGDRNMASIMQGTAGSFATVSQSGIANIVAIRQ
ncbi:hypothetical protein [Sphingobium tyrosinilyticum]|uniref:Curlin n=1 Tax=Sphingobium tyrosinilyticum TaxID=2715436 RepID=A0ABV9EZP7_9SPHN